MKRIKGANLAGAALCLALLGSTAGFAQAPNPPSTYTGAPNPPVAAPAPVSPAVQPTPTAPEPTLQPQPATQAQPAIQSNLPAKPPRVMNSRSPHALVPTPAGNSGAPNPSSPNTLPGSPTPVTPTPKLLNDSDLPQPGSYTATKHKTTRHKAVKHKGTRHKSTHRAPVRHSSHTSGKSHLRAAQVYLEQLGYEPGPTDGMMGRKTTAAIKEFQRDHRLKATGVLNASTFAALEREAGSKNPSHHGPEPQADFVATHPDFYGYYGNNEGVSPTSLSSPQSIPSRYGNLQVEEQKNGPVSSFIVTVNGQQVYRADNQPSFINVSRTFEVGDDDAIVLTSYNSGNTACPYQHRLLIVKSSGNYARDIANCTRDYEAYTQNGMLMISFPGSHVDGWSSGDTWRYDHGTFEKL